jgi:polar amino acid transport system substrate-binding protein
MQPLSLQINVHLKEMTMKKNNVLISLIVMVAIVLAACGVSTPAIAQTSAPTITQTSVPKDLLSEIQSRGYMLVETWPNLSGGPRSATTKCPSDTYTALQMQSFDTDVAVEIGKRLGVEICFVTSMAWPTVTAGSWGGKWNISIASMPITNKFSQVLTFTVPYYYNYADVVVEKGSGINTLDDLSGKVMCAESLTTYENWLKGNLDLPAADVFAQPPSNVKVKSVPLGGTCSRSMYGFGTAFIAYVDASFMIDSDIAMGVPIVKLGDPVFRESNAAAVDKSSSLPTDSFVAELNQIITAMHSDGTLTKLSIQDNGADYTQPLK